jgi:hypothetical protein
MLNVKRLTSTSKEQTSILRIYALIGLIIKVTDDIKMDLRQAGIVHRPIVSLACVADNSDTGEN